MLYDKFNKLISFLILIFGTLFASADIDTDLIESAHAGRIQEVLELLILGANPNVDSAEALTGAFWNGHTEITDLLIKHGADPKFLWTSKLMTSMRAKNFSDFKSIFDSQQLNLNDPELLAEILLSEDYVFVKYAFDNVPELKDAYLIGLNNFRGAWTDKIRSVIELKLKDHPNAFLVNISLELAHDDDIMQHFSGFINPGAADTYPRHDRPFKIEDIDSEAMDLHEKVYQQVITMAKKYDIPYYGICAGSQHLVLNSHGSLKESGHYGEIKITFKPGSIPHFLLLTDNEKLEAVSKCKLPNIELTDAYTEHSYAAYVGDLGKGIKLAAVSEAGIPEAFSLGANKIGTQFHPENHYADETYLGINRHKQFLDSIFAIFEGYHQSMQYAKTMGIDRETVKAALQRANQVLVDHLEHCVLQD